MKLLRWAALPVALASLLLTALQASAQPATQTCDYVSYAINSRGQCIDMSDFTRLGVLETKITDLKRQISPIAFRDLKLRRQDGKTYIVGTAFNQSRRPISAVVAYLNLTRMVDGYPKQLGIETIGINETIPSGGSVPILLEIDNIKSISGVSVSVAKVNPIEL